MKVWCVGGAGRSRATRAWDHQINHRLRPRWIGILWHPSSRRDGERSSWGVRAGRRGKGNKKSSLTAPGCGPAELKWGKSCTVCIYVQQPVGLIALPKKNDRPRCLHVGFSVGGMFRCTVRTPAPSLSCTTLSYFLINPIDSVGLAVLCRRCAVDVCTCCAYATANCSMLGQGTPYTPY